ncbi:hypothetical protein HH310_13750 [Actinoplanes sp. TBRC 11911]|nr:hypothetical protein [Actinoplanes sp. TBRC 11911]
MAAAVLVAIAAFALVISVVGVWSARTALSTDRFVSAVAPLPQNPQVAAAVSTYATGQIFEAVDVEQRLREVLPQQAGFVIGPLVGQLQTQVRNTVDNVLQSERFQPIWTELVRRTHTRVMEIVNGDSAIVQSAGDQVNIDLLPLINQVLRTISAELPTLFGKQITLPDLSSGAIPDNLRVRVEDALGVTLPANFAQFTVYDSGKLQAAQDAVVAAKRYLALGVAATILLLVLALVISPARRRTVLQLGLWLVIAAIAVTAILRAVRRELLAQVPEGVYRDGFAATLTTVLGGLRERGTQLIWLGAIIAVVAYLVGPGRLPVWLRRQVVRGGRAAGRGIQVAAVHAPDWIADHLDPVRIGGAVVAGILALILSSWLSLLIIVIVLAVFEVAVTLIARARPRTSEATS